MVEAEILRDFRGNQLESSGQSLLHQRNDIFADDFEILIDYRIDRITWKRNEFNGMKLNMLRAFR